jgi:hypothetical protein
MGCSWHSGDIFVVALARRFSLLPSWHLFVAIVLGHSSATFKAIGVGLVYQDSEIDLSGANHQQNLKPIKYYWSMRKTAGV